jgi:hypothetical protein
MSRSKSESLDAFGNARCPIQIGACRGVGAKHVIIMLASRFKMTCGRGFDDLWRSLAVCSFLFPPFKKRLGETWRSGEK